MLLSKMLARNHAPVISRTAPIISQAIPIISEATPVISRTATVAQAGGEHVPQVRDVNAAFTHRVIHRTAACVRHNTQLPPSSVATTAPLLILKHKNIRLLIHTLAILHARSIFASASVAVTLDGLMLRDQALIKTLKLQDYVTVKSKLEVLCLANRTAPHLAVQLVDEPPESVTLQAYQLSGFTVINGTDPTINAVKMKRGYYAVPMLDPQALANLLSQFLIHPGAQVIKQARSVGLV